MPYERPMIEYVLYVTNDDPQFLRVPCQGEYFDVIPGVYARVEAVLHCSEVTESGIRRFARVYCSDGTEKFLNLTAASTTAVASRN